MITLFLFCSFNVTLCLLPAISFKISKLDFVQIMSYILLER